MLNVVKGICFKRCYISMKFCSIFSWLQLQPLLRKGCLDPMRRFSTGIILNNSDGEDPPQKKPKSIGDHFIDSEVQSILLKITGLDYAKIFRPVQQKLSAPRYAFATDERLKELQEMARVQALKKLQIPPVVEVREPIDEVMSYDPELQGLISWNMLFIDISSNVPERERFITVREPDGTLRKANWDERFRMNQMYFPTPGRKLIVPEYFSSPHLDRLQDEEFYLFILDSACIQFEPDDPDYHRVTHTTYDHISSRKKFDVLRSTRHFGAMAFYFAWKRKIEGLLVDMIERNLIADAASLIKLFCIIHELPIETKTDLERVSDFIAENNSSYKSDLEMALQTYKELHSGTENEEEMKRDISA